MACAYVAVIIEIPLKINPTDMIRIAGIPIFFISSDAENNVNILDISQTILHGKFTMVMAVDIEKLPCSFTDLAARLSALGEEMGIAIRVQRQEIFDAMHRI